MVDEQSQVVLAAEVTQEAGDVDQLVPMTERSEEENLAEAGVSGSPKTLLVDAGYCSEENLEAAEGLNPDVLCATGTGNATVRSSRRHHAARSRRTPTRREKMARRLRTKKGRADYARRKAIVEPAFGQVKVRQHAGQLRFRGLAGAQGEWTLHMLCHNLRKLQNAGGSTAHSVRMRP